MKRSALKAMRRDAPEITTWLAMLGPCVAVPHGKEMARLAVRCSYVHESLASSLQRALSLAPDAQHDKLRKVAQDSQRRRVRWAKRWLAPRLAAVLWDSLARLDPQPLKHFAAIVQRIREHNEARQGEARQQAHPFHEKALRLARVLEAKHAISPDVAWPVTRAKFLELLEVPEKEHDEASYERRELKRLPIAFAPDKRGPKKATRKRGT